MIAYCLKFKKRVDDVLPTECGRTCSDYADGKQCGSFEAITEQEYKQRWRN